MIDSLSRAIYFPAHCSILLLFQTRSEGRTILALLYSYSTLYLTSTWGPYSFSRLFGARTPHAHACHISQCIHIPAATSTGFNFFFPSVSYSISRNVLGFVFSPPFLMLPVHCSEQYCPWLCKQCNVFCRLFLFLIPRSSFLFSYLLCNTQYSF